MYKHKLLADHQYLKSLQFTNYSVVLKTVCVCVYIANNEYIKLMHVVSCEKQKSSLLFKTFP